MSLIWFRSCNTATRFCEGGNNNVVFVQKCFSVCYFGKVKGGSLARLEEIDQEGLISLFFSE